MSGDVADATTDLTKMTMTTTTDDIGQHLENDTIARKITTITIAKTATATMIEIATAITIKIATAIAMIETTTAPMMITKMTRIVDHRTKEIDIETEMMIEIDIGQITMIASWEILTEKEKEKGRIMMIEDMKDTLCMIDMIRLGDTLGDIPLVDMLLGGIEDRRMTMDTEVTDQVLGEDLMKGKRHQVCFLPLKLN